ncbi:hypothetical protein [Spirosoma rhododendri]|uniref:O-antigen polysaccharide polymerase Wzy n=1 Tax=Spirosoma rhododendri TaxID=2728024 RepID=A0A7L5DGQ7_9BACT|nr:hypothetical protein [Spirosoma rhododendri]QJD77444.1 hypothetical protein HH216_02705 [Spirosoma rhododendri]
MKRILATLVVFWVAYVGWKGTLPEAIAFALPVYCFLTFVNQISRRIALLECIAFVAALEILQIPAVTYWLLPASMPIESDVYFSYALPAFSLFYLGLMVRPGQSEIDHAAAIRSTIDALRHNQRAGLVLLLIGLAGYGVRTLMPGAPTFVSHIPSYCLFISVLYTWYARSPLRWLIVGLVVVVLGMYTIREGMFGELFFWLMLLTLFLTTGRTTPLSATTKTAFVTSAFALLLLIQSVKAEYRFSTWGHTRKERSGNAGLMGELLADRLTDPSKLLTPAHFFSSFMRFNQGLMIGSAMAKVPRHEPYAGGEVLLSLVYPFVPRLLWPGKPQTGGYENIRRFTSLPQSENTSINLSPLGEGYVNFGYGGLLFALGYGGLLGYVFRRVFQLAKQQPTLILWLPMLFVGCLTMETDLLSTWGSLLNNALFLLVLYGLLKRFSIQL